MTATDVWTPFEGNSKEIIREYREPVLALARGEVPALVLRGAYDPRHCSELIEASYTIHMRAQRKTRILILWLSGPPGDRIPNFAFQTPICRRAVFPEFEWR